MNGFNSKMKSQNMKVLMFYDNCPAHLAKMNEMNFSNVKIILLPKNTTTSTQTLDAGIIKNFKFISSYITKFA
jgi:hypothetical protein